MAEKKVSFEENMTKLEQIVNELQSGDVPLEKALTEFQTGVKLSQEMQRRDVRSLSKPIQVRRSTHTVFMISRSNVFMSTNVSS